MFVNYYSIYFIWYFFAIKMNKKVISVHWNNFLRFVFFWKILLNALKVGFYDVIYIKKNYMYAKKG